MFHEIYGCMAVRQMIKSALYTLKETEKLIRKHTKLMVIADIVNINIYKHKDKHTKPFQNNFIVIYLLN